MQKVHQDQQPLKNYTQLLINLVKRLTVYRLPVVMVLKFNVLMPMDY